MAAEIEDPILAELRAERESSLLGPESPEGRALGRAIGTAVERERAARGIDLETLSERSEIPVPLLEALTGGDAVPSLRAIWRLATALGVPFSRLLRETGFPEGSAVTVVREGEGRVVRNASGSFQSRLLFPEGDPLVPEVYELRLAPGSVEEAGAHGPGTTEHLTIIEGRLRLRVGDDAFDLGEGDAISFRADVAHRYENDGDRPTRALLVMHYTEGPGGDAA